MPNRVTGMFSGLDTETLIQDLVKARSGKVEKLNKSKTKLEWKQEAWSDLNKKVKKFFSNSVSNLRWSTSFTKKTTTVSNPNAVSVITGDKAMNSVQKLSVTKLAQTGYLTGAKVSSSDGTDATSESLVSSLEFNGTSISGSGSFNVTVNGTTTTINIDADTTIASVVSKLNSAGINANFDEKNQRMFIGAKQSGKDNDFTITANDATGANALSVLGINAAPTEDTIKEYDKLSAFSSYIGATNAETVENIQAAGVDSEIYKRLSALAKTNFQKEVDAQQKVVNEKKAAVDELVGVDTSEMDEDTLAAHNAAIEAATAEFDAENTKLSELQTDLGAGNYSVAATEAAAEALANQINYAETAKAAPDTSYNSDAVRLSGDNAEIVLNGATFTSDTNNISVNGLTFTCNALAENITVTTQDDTDGIYDMIKGFMKEYNTLINEIDSLYNAEATKIEPLTDEEKDAVSETEAEKLEKKVRDSLLRKDESLNSLFSGLRDVMSSGFTVGDQTMYLSNFGINTLSYFSAPEGERYAYHIDGDADDDDTSGNADKLKTMIANDPDSVVSFFTQLGKSLYGKLNDLSAASDYTTYGSFYQDKKMKTELSDYEKKIADAEQALQDYEDKYYDKFAAMEVALSKMQSNTNYLSSLFQ